MSANALPSVCTFAHHGHPIQKTLPSVACACYIIWQGFANGSPASACDGQAFAKPKVCLRRPSICFQFACDGHAFANGLPVTAKHLPMVCLPKFAYGL
jgi:hypothetical protein